MGGICSLITFFLFFECFKHHHRHHDINEKIIDFFFFLLWCEYFLSNYFFWDYKPILKNNNFTIIKYFKHFKVPSWLLLCTISNLKEVAEQFFFIYPLFALHGI